MAIQVGSRVMISDKHNLGTFNRRVGTVVSKGRHYDWIVSGFVDWFSRPVDDVPMDSEELIELTDTCN